MNHMQPANRALPRADMAGRRIVAGLTASSMRARAPPQWTFAPGIRTGARACIRTDIWESKIFREYGILARVVAGHPKPSD